MLNQLNASVMEMDMTIRHFSGKGVSYAAVEDFIRQIRSTP
jgi:hypothetical protein